MEHRAWCDRWDADRPCYRGGLVGIPTSSECVFERPHPHFLRARHTQARGEANLRSLEIYLSGGTSKHIHRHQHHRHAHQSPHRTYPSQRNRSSITRGAVGHSIPLVEGRRALRSAGVEPERLATKAWRGGCRDRSELRTEQNRSISVGCDDAYALTLYLGIHAHAHMHG